VSTSGISIRSAEVDDSSSVRSLARSLATSFTLDDDSFGEIFNRLSEDEGARILVSTDEDGVINGYLLGFVHDAFFANGAVAWIEEMFVSDTSRLKGIGLALERAFEVWARERDAKLIALATRRAAPFYKAIGYEESAVYYRRLL
jgi:GNAT superfamily N-acetyltransferase